MDKFSLPQYNIGSPSCPMPSPSRNDNVHVSGGNGNAENHNVDCCLWCFPLCTIPEQEDIPEQKMTLWAVRLAFLEKAGSRLGTMKFIWATAILLGGFVDTLESIDFWFVSIILVVGGLRILELGDLAPSSPYFDGEFMIMKIHSAIIQEYGSLTCLLLSGYRLTREKYGSKSSPNQNEALNIFYWLSVAESLLILFVFFLKIGFGISPLWLLSLPESPNLQDSPKGIIRRGFWKLFSWICRGRLIYEMQEKYEFDDSQLRTVHRFFYETYSRCINGSIFHGLKMEFVSYSVELLQCSDRKEQLAGVQLLSAVVKNRPLALQRIRATGTVQDVVEMLINMLNWGEPEEEFREAAAQIISNLVKIHRHRILVMTIPESMESIASLLYDNSQPDEKHFTLMGLGILKMLSSHDNCSKFGSNRGLKTLRAIGTMRGLLEILIKMLNRVQQNEIRILAAEIISNMVEIDGNRIRLMAIPESMECIESLLSIQSPDVQPSDLSLPGLRILKMLANDHYNCAKIGSNIGLLGKVIGLTGLNHNASEIPTPLKNLAIDTLTSLAREPEVRDSIGGTAGVLHNLFSLFFKERIDNNNQELVTKAGEALGFLSLENKHNCEIMINITLGGHPNLIARLISVLTDPNEPVQGIYAAKILRNLLAYAPDCVKLKEKEITAASAKVVDLVMKKRGEHQEAAIGLAAQIFKFMSKSDFDRVFKEGGAEKKRSLISKLVEVFWSYPRPSKEVPSIRRFSIELLIAVMEKDRSTIEMRSELEDALEGVMETTSELESYSTFSGTLGLSSHRMAIRSLVKSAMSLLRN